ncbi:MAG: peptidoglycan-binding protein [Paracoccaceae bacterium]
MALVQGMNGPPIRDLQAALNLRLNPSPNLRVSGHYDAATADAVRIFQRANWLAVDGIVGPATMDAIEGREQGAQIRHNIPYFPQPAPHLGWAAAVAMIRRSSPAAVRQMTPSRFLTPQGDLVGDAIGHHQRAEMHRAFASQHALRYRPARNWPVSALLQVLRAGPVMVEYPRRAAAHVRGTGSLFLVLTGARGAHRPDGLSTTLRVFDPDGEHTPGIYSLSHADLMERVPPGGYAMFWL